MHWFFRYRAEKQTDRQMEVKAYLPRRLPWTWLTTHWTSTFPLTDSICATLDSSVIASHLFYHFYCF